MELQTLSSNKRLAINEFYDLVILPGFKNSENHKEWLYPFVLLFKSKEEWDREWRLIVSVIPGIAKFADPVKGGGFSLHAALRESKYCNFYTSIGIACVLARRNENDRRRIQGWLSPVASSNSRKTVAERRELVISANLPLDSGWIMYQDLCDSLQALKPRYKTLYHPDLQYAFWMGEDPPLEHEVRHEIKARLCSRHENNPNRTNARKSKRFKAPKVRSNQNINSPTKPIKRRSISLGLRRAILERDGYRCVDCGRSPRTDSSCVLHIDHRVPLAKGGTNEEANLQTLCDWCNLGKGVDLDWKLNQAC